MKLVYFYLVFEIIVLTLIDMNIFTTIQAIYYLNMYNSYDRNSSVHEMIKKINL